MPAVRTGSPDALVALLDGGDRRSGATVLVTGVPGVGKTTTLDAVCRALDARGVRAYRATADELSLRQPYGLVCALLGLLPAYPPRADTVDRALETVELLCADGPVVLCADDLHHADADSLALLGRLTAATRDLPVALLLARRPLPTRDVLTALAARPDVHGVELVGLDGPGLSGLVEARFGAPPGPRLRAALDVTSGNPFHAGAVLDELARRAGIEHVDGTVEVRGDGTGAAPSLREGVRAHLALLDPDARDLVSVLAVHGRAATPEQLAAVTGAAVGGLLRAVQAAVSSGVVHWTPDDLLAFRHDLYREVVYDDLAPPLRRVLHAACAAQLRASGGIATVVAHHAGGAAAGKDPGAVAALRAAAADLRHAPAQAADLLTAAAELAADGPEADAVAVARAGALAASGQVVEADRVARAHLATARDPAARDQLTRLRIHALTSAADTAGALAVLDERLAQPGPEPLREALTDVRRWIVVLAGRDPVGGPAVTRRTGAALVPQALERFLAAACEDALELGVAARDARAASAAPPWADGATAPIWPAWFALYAQGPEAARRMSQDARREAQENGRGWLVPYHLFVAASIDYLAGRWDDAVAELATGLEAAQATGTGWLGRALGGLLHVQARRGQLDVAEATLRRWQVRGLPEQFGLPVVGQAELLLAEARGRPEEVLERAARQWADALDQGRLLWGLLAGPDLARVALRAGDAPLAARVADDVARIPTGQVGTLAPVADVVRAMVERDPDRASAAAVALRHRGNVLGEVGAWEEAAVAAAPTDPDRARTCAARCLELAASLGAATVERRLTARLRTHDVRLGVTGARKRPTSGWGSLTPTELQVAELVGQGLTSPQIATRLFVSPRTVQTHISHSLRKLGLRSRVELATTVTRHRR